MTIQSNDNVVPQPKYEVTLPCSPDDFSSFISGLLGKPQTLLRDIPGEFHISRDDVVNLFHLVDQRIHAQNDATLVQFLVRIVFNDGSSELLNGLDHLMSYSEIRPIASVAVHLSWSYLIKFRNRPAPEKQEIDLSFNGTDPMRHKIRSMVYIDDENHRYGIRGASSISLRIRHSNRTWGVDIDSLVSGHVATLLIEKNKIRNLIARFSGQIGLAVGVALFLAAVYTVYAASNSVLTDNMERFKKLTATVSGSAEIIGQKLDVLAELIAGGVWPRFSFAALAFLLGSLAISVFFGIWVSSVAEIRRRSLVLLSKQTEDYKKSHGSAIRRDWMMFVLSLVASLGTGIVSSWLFNKYFS